MNKDRIKYFSTFSGIGGFEHGIEKAFDSYIRTSQIGRSKEGRNGNTNEDRVQLHDRQRKPVCVGYSEIDKYAKAIYEYQYPTHRNYGDITTINESELPDFELFVGGFPCQAFSIAGKRQGFEDTRGTLFFDVARILSAKRPEWFILENVKGLLNHDNGRTIGTIFRVLSELGYAVGWEVVNSCHVCVPQNRERIFIIGCTSAERLREVFPIREETKRINERAKQASVVRTLTAGGNSGGMHSSMTLIADSGLNRRWENRDICPPLRAGTAPGQHEKLVVGTFRTHKDGEGFRETDSGLCPTIPARAREDGSGQPVIKSVLTPDRLEKRQNGRRIKENGEPSFTLTSQDKHGVMINERIRRLTPIESERLQDFPDNWTKYGLFKGVKKEISDTQRYKCLGNAVTTGVVELIMKKILEIAV